MAKKKNQKAHEGSDCSMDKKMFTRINALILKDDNYLTPKLSRDFILKRTNVPKNKFAPLFRKYLGIKFTDYVNGMRLDHAAKQLREHPEYTVETIAQECGIPKLQTFYRLFSLKYGMPPAEYRNKHL